MAKRPKGPTKQRAERMAKALRLREAGLTYEQIGNKLGISTSQVERDLKDALKLTIQEPADSLRKLEALRLDALQRAIWQQALRGNLQAVNQALKIQERRAKLLNLDSTGGDIVDDELTTLLDTLLSMEPAQ